MPETIGPLVLLLGAAAVGFVLGWKLRLTLLMRGAPAEVASDLMGDGSKAEEPDAKKWRAEAIDRRLDSLTLHFMLALSSERVDEVDAWERARKLAACYLTHESEASKKSPAYL